MVAFHSKNTNVWNNQYNPLPKFCYSLAMTQDNNKYKYKNNQKNRHTISGVCLVHLNHLFLIFDLFANTDVSNLPLMIDFLLTLFCCHRDIRQSDFYILPNWSEIQSKKKQNY